MRMGIEKASWVYILGIMTLIRKILISCIAVITFTAAAQAEKLSLTEISDYLNSLENVSADFQQSNEDGSVSTGKLLIRRPGRLRLEYGGEFAPLVLVSGGQVGVFDPSSNEPPTRFPLNQTPLSIILKRNVDLTQTKMVVSHTARGNDTYVRAQDPDHPEYGYIDLIFGDAPILKAWKIKSQDGSETFIQLTKMELGGSLKSSLFNIKSEAKKRGTPIE